MPDNLDVHRAQMAVHVALLGLIAVHQGGFNEVCSITATVILDDGVTSETQYECEGLIDGRRGLIVGGTL